MVDYSGNKVASNLNLPPLPEIGDAAALWEELCDDQSLAGAALKLISDSARREAADFLRDLPGPVVLLHSHGNTSQKEKNIPDATVLALCRELLRCSHASIVMLDWDDRVPRLTSGRVRHIKDDWGHLDLDQLAALYERADLFIGIDSGPYHFAALTDTPALGVFHEHYPTCLALPRSLTLNMVPAKYRELNVPRRRRWNLVEYEGDIPAAEDIARHALRMIEGPRYLKDKRRIAHDVQLQQWVLDWCEGSTALAQLADRNNTFDLACQRVGQFGHKPTIVETGCIRSPEDWSGAGHSTYLFAALLDRLGGGRLVTIRRKWPSPRMP